MSINNDDFFNFDDILGGDPPQTPLDPFEQIAAQAEQTQIDNKKYFDELNKGFSRYQEIARIDYEKKMGEIRESLSSSPVPSGPEATAEVAATTTPTDPEQITWIDPNTGDTHTGTYVDEVTAEDGTVTKTTMTPTLDGMISIETMITKPGEEPQKTSLEGSVVTKGANPDNNFYGTDVSNVVKYLDDNNLTATPEQIAGLFARMKNESPEAVTDQELVDMVINRLNEKNNLPEIENPSQYLNQNYISSSDATKEFFDLQDRMTESQKVDGWMDSNNEKILGFETKDGEIIGEEGLTLKSALWTSGILSDDYAAQLDLAQEVYEEYAESVMNSDSPYTVLLAAEQTLINRMERLTGDDKAVSGTRSRFRDYMKNLIDYKNFDLARQLQDSIPEKAKYDFGKEDQAFAKESLGVSLKKFGDMGKEDALAVVSKAQELYISSEDPEEKRLAGQFLSKLNTNGAFDQWASGISSRLEMRVDNARNNGFYYDGFLNSMTDDRADVAGDYQFGWVVDLFDKGVNHIQNRWREASEGNYEGLKDDAGDLAAALSRDPNTRLMNQAHKLERATKTGRVKDIVGTGRVFDLDENGNLIYNQNITLSTAARAQREYSTPASFDYTRKTQFFADSTGVEVTMDNDSREALVLMTGEKVVAVGGGSERKYNKSDAEEEGIEYDESKDFAGATFMIQGSDGTFRDLTPNQREKLRDPEFQKNFLTRSNNEIEVLTRGERVSGVALTAESTIIDTIAISAITYLTGGTGTGVALTGRLGTLASRGGMLGRYGARMIANVGTKGFHTTAGYYLLSGYERNLGDYYAKYGVSKESRRAALAAATTEAYISAFFGAVDSPNIFSTATNKLGTKKLMGDFFRGKIGRKAAIRQMKDMGWDTSMEMFEELVIPLTNDLSAQLTGLTDNKIAQREMWEETKRYNDASTWVNIIATTGFSTGILSSRGARAGYQAHKNALTLNQENVQELMSRDINDIKNQAADLYTETGNESYNELSTLLESNKELFDRADDKQKEEISQSIANEFLNKKEISELSKLDQDLATRKAIRAKENSVLASRATRQRIQAQLDGIENAEKQQKEGVIFETGQIISTSKETRLDELDDANNETGNFVNVSAGIFEVLETTDDNGSTVVQEKSTGKKYSLKTTKKDGKFLNSSNMNVVREKAYEGSTFKRATQSEERKKYIGQKIEELSNKQDRTVSDEVELAHYKRISDKEFGTNYGYNDDSNVAQEVNNKRIKYKTAKAIADKVANKEALTSEETAAISLDDAESRANFELAFQEAGLSFTDSFNTNNKVDKVNVQHKHSNGKDVVLQVDPKILRQAAAISDNDARNKFIEDNSVENKVFYKKDGTVSAKGKKLPTSGAAVADSSNIVNSKIKKKKYKGKQTTSNLLNELIDNYASNMVTRENSKDQQNGRGFNTMVRPVVIEKSNGVLDNTTFGDKKNKEAGNLIEDQKSRVAVGDAVYLGQSDIDGMHYVRMNSTGEVLLVEESKITEFREPTTQLGVSEKAYESAVKFVDALPGSKDLTDEQKKAYVAAVLTIAKSGANNAGISIEAALSSIILREVKNNNMSATVAQTMLEEEEELEEEGVNEVVEEGDDNLKTMLEIMGEDPENTSSAKIAEAKGLLTRINNHRNKKREENISKGIMIEDDTTLGDVADTLTLVDGPEGRKGFIASSPSGEFKFIDLENRRKDFKFVFNGGDPSQFKVSDIPDIGKAEEVPAATEETQYSFGDNMEFEHNGKTYAPKGTPVFGTDKNGKRFVSFKQEGSKRAVKFTNEGLVNSLSTEMSMRNLAEVEMINTEGGFTTPQLIDAVENAIKDTLPPGVDSRKAAVLVTAAIRDHNKNNAKVDDLNSMDQIELVSGAFKTKRVAELFNRWNDPSNIVYTEGITGKEGALNQEVNTKIQYQLRGLQALDALASIANTKATRKGYTKGDVVMETVNIDKLDNFKKQLARRGTTKDNIAKIEAMVMNVAAVTGSKKVNLKTVLDIMKEQNSFELEFDYVKVDKTSRVTPDPYSFFDVNGVTGRPRANSYNRDKFDPDNSYDFSEKDAREFASRLEGNRVFDVDFNGLNKIPVENRSFYDSDTEPGTLFMFPNMKDVLLSELVTFGLNKESTDIEVYAGEGAMYYSLIDKSNGKRATYKLDDYTNRRRSRSVFAIVYSQETELDVKTTQYGWDQVTLREYHKDPDYEYSEFVLTTPFDVANKKHYNSTKHKKKGKVFGHVRAYENKKTGEFVVIEVQSDLYQQYDADNRNQPVPPLLDRSLFNTAYISFQNNVEKIREVGAIDLHDADYYTDMLAESIRDMMTNDDNIMNPPFGYGELFEAIQGILDVDRVKSGEKPTEEQVQRIIEAQRKLTEPRLSEGKTNFLVDKKNTRREVFMERLANGKWANFLVDATVQHAVKNGYTTVKLPVGETAAIVEGHANERDISSKYDNEIDNLNIDLRNTKRKLEAIETGQVDEVKREVLGYLAESGEMIRLEVIKNQRFMKEAQRLGLTGADLINEAFPRMDTAEADRRARLSEGLFSEKPKMKLTPTDETIDGENYEGDVLATDEYLIADAINMDNPNRRAVEKIVKNRRTGEVVRVSFSAVTDINRQNKVGSNETVLTFEDIKNASEIFNDESGKFHRKIFRGLQLNALRRYNYMYYETMTELADPNSDMHKEVLDSLNKEIKKLNKFKKGKQEKKEAEIKEAKDSNIYKFYDERVSGITKKYYKSKVTKDKGFEFNEIKVDDKTKAKAKNVMFQRDQHQKIKGQAILNEFKILIDPKLRTKDTLDHEKAHFYINMFRDTKLVKEAMKKFGGEEQLVQYIGEQAVNPNNKEVQEAMNWWKRFSKWLMDLFDGMDKKTKEELGNALTAAYKSQVDIEAAEKAFDALKGGKFVSMPKRRAKKDRTLFIDPSAIASAIDQLSPEAKAEAAVMFADQGIEIEDDFLENLKNQMPVEEQTKVVEGIREEQRKEEEPVDLIPSRLVGAPILKSELPEAYRDDPYLESVTITSFIESNSKEETYGVEFKLDDGTVETGELTLPRSNKLPPSKTEKKQNAVKNKEKKKEQDPPMTFKDAVEKLGVTETQALNPFFMTGDKKIDEALNKQRRAENLSSAGLGKVKRAKVFRDQQGEDSKVNPFTIKVRVNPDNYNEYSIELMHNRTSKGTVSGLKIENPEDLWIFYNSKRPEPGLVQDMMDKHFSHIQEEPALRPQVVPVKNQIKRLANGTGIEVNFSAKNLPSGFDNSPDNIMFDPMNPGIIHVKEGVSFSELQLLKTAIGLRRDFAEKESAYREFLKTVGLELPKDTKLTRDTMYAALIGSKYPGEKGEARNYSDVVADQLIERSGVDVAINTELSTQLARFMVIPTTNRNLTATQTLLGFATALENLNTSRRGKNAKIDLINQVSRLMDQYDIGQILSNAGAGMYTDTYKKEIVVDQDQKQEVTTPGPIGILNERVIPAMKEAGMNPYEMFSKYLFNQDQDGLLNTSGLSVSTTAGSKDVTLKLTSEEEVKLYAELRKKYAAAANKRLSLATQDPSGRNIGTNIPKEVFRKRLNKNNTKTIPISMSDLALGFDLKDFTVAELGFDSREFDLNKVKVLKEKVQRAQAKRMIEITNDSRMMNKGAINRGGLGLVFEGSKGMHVRNGMSLSERNELLNKPFSEDENGAIEARMEELAARAAKNAKINPAKKPFTDLKKKVRAEFVNRNKANFLSEYSKRDNYMAGYDRYLDIYNSIETKLFNSKGKLNSIAKNGKLEIKQLEEMGFVGPLAKDVINKSGAKNIAELKQMIKNDALGLEDNGFGPLITGDRAKHGKDNPFFIDKSGRITMHPTVFIKPKPKTESQFKSFLDTRGEMALKQITEGKQVNPLSRVSRFYMQFFTPENLVDFAKGIEVDGDMSLDLEAAVDKVTRSGMNLDEAGLAAIGTDVFALEETTEKAIEMAKDNLRSSVLRDSMDQYREQAENEVRQNRKDDAGISVNNFYYSGEVLPVSESENIINISKKTTGINYVDVNGNKADSNAGKFMVFTNDSELAFASGKSGKATAVIFKTEDEGKTFMNGASDAATFSAPVSNDPNYIAGYNKTARVLTYANFPHINIETNRSGEISDVTFLVSPDMKKQNEITSNQLAQPTRSIIKKGENVLEAMEKEAKKITGPIKKPRTSTKKVVKTPLTEYEQRPLGSSLEKGEKALMVLNEDGTKVISDVMYVFKDDSALIPVVQKLKSGKPVIVTEIKGTIGQDGTVDLRDVVLSKDKDIKLNSSFSIPVNRFTADQQGKLNINDEAAIQEEIDLLISKVADLVAARKALVPELTSADENVKAAAKDKSRAISAQIRETNDKIDAYEKNRIDAIANSREDFSPQYVSREQEGPDATVSQLDNALESLSERISGAGVNGFDSYNDPKDNRRGYFDPNKKKVFVNYAHAKADTPYHEFAHPLVLGIKHTNKDLYKEMIKEVESSERGRELVDSISRNPGYANLSPMEVREEALVQMIGEQAADSAAKEKGLVDKLMDWLKNLLGFKKEVVIENLGPGTSIKHFAEFMANADTMIKVLDGDTQVENSSENINAILDKGTDGRVASREMYKAKIASSGAKTVRFNSEHLLEAQKVFGNNPTTTDGDITVMSLPKANVNNQLIPINFAQSKNLGNSSVAAVIAGNVKNYNDNVDNMDANDLYKMTGIKEYPSGLFMEYSFFEHYTNKMFNVDREMLALGRPMELVKDAKDVLPKELIEVLNKEIEYDGETFRPIDRLKFRFLDTSVDLGDGVYAEYRTDISNPVISIRVAQGVPNEYLGLNITHETQHFIQDLMGEGKTQWFNPLQDANKERLREVGLDADEVYDFSWWEKEANAASLASIRGLDDSQRMVAQMFTGDMITDLEENLAQSTADMKNNVAVSLDGKQVHISFGGKAVGTITDADAEAKSMASRSKKESLESQGFTFDAPYDDFGDFDYEAEEQAEKIANERGVNILRGKELSQVVRNPEGEVVGAAFIEADGNEYSFDIVVDKDHEGKGIGSVLVDEHVDVPDDMIDFNPDMKAKIDVINPSMKAMLEARGFEATQKVADGRFIMERKEDVLLQERDGVEKGSFEVTKRDKKTGKMTEAVMTLTDDADVTTLLHELAHWYASTLSSDQKIDIMNAFGLGTNKWDKAAEELFADAVELAFLKGKVDIPYLEKEMIEVKKAFQEVYDGTNFPKSVKDRMRKFVNGEAKPLTNDDLDQVVANLMMNNFSPELFNSPYNDFKEFDVDSYNLRAAAQKANSIIADIAMKNGIDLGNITIQEYRDIVDQKLDSYETTLDPYADIAEKAFNYAMMNFVFENSSNKPVVTNGMNLEQAIRAVVPDGGINIAALTEGQLDDLIQNLGEVNKMYAASIIQARNTMNKLNDLGYRVNMIMHPDDLSLSRELSVEDASASNQSSSLVNAFMISSGGKKSTDTVMDLNIHVNAMAPAQTLGVDMFSSVMAAVSMSSSNSNEQSQLRDKLKEMASLQQLSNDDKAMTIRELADALAKDMEARRLGRNPQHTLVMADKVINSVRYSLRKMTGKSNIHDSDIEQFLKTYASFDKRLLDDNGNLKTDQLDNELSVQNSGNVTEINYVHRVNVDPSALQLIDAIANGIDVAGVAISDKTYKQIESLYGEEAVEEVKKSQAHRAGLRDLRKNLKKSASLDSIQMDNAIAYVRAAEAGGISEGVILEHLENRGLGHVAATAYFLATDKIVSARYNDESMFPDYRVYSSGYRDMIRKFADRNEPIRIIQMLLADQKGPLGTNENPYTALELAAERANQHNENIFKNLYGVEDRKSVQILPQYRELTQGKKEYDVRINESALFQRMLRDGLFKFSPDKTGMETDIINEYAVKRHVPERLARRLAAQQAYLDAYVELQNKLETAAKMDDQYDQPAIEADLKEVKQAIKQLKEGMTATRNAKAEAEVRLRDFKDKMEAKRQDENDPLSATIDQMDEYLKEFKELVTDPYLDLRRKSGVLNSKSHDSLKNGKRTLREKVSTSRNSLGSDGVINIEQEMPQFEYYVPLERVAKDDVGNSIKPYDGSTDPANAVIRSIDLTKNSLIAPEIDLSYKDVHPPLDSMASNTLNHSEKLIENEALSQVATVVAENIPGWKIKKIGSRSPHSLKDGDLLFMKGGVRYAMVPERMPEESYHDFNRRKENDQISRWIKSLGRDPKLSLLEGAIDSLNKAEKQTGKYYRLKAAVMALGAFRALSNLARSTFTTVNLRFIYRNFMVDAFSTMYVRLDKELRDAGIKMNSRQRRQARRKFIAYAIKSFGNEVMHQVSSGQFKGLIFSDRKAKNFDDKSLANSEYVKLREQAFEEGAMMTYSKTVKGFSKYDQRKSTLDEENYRRLADRMEKARERGFIASAKKGKIGKGTVDLFKDTARYIPELTYGFVDILGQASELASRMATYQIAKDYGLTNSQAAGAARGVTINFERKGAFAEENAIYRTLLNSTLFLNVAIQGMNLMINRQLLDSKIKKKSSPSSEFQTDRDRIKNKIDHLKNNFFPEVILPKLNILTHSILTGLAQGIAAGADEEEWGSARAKQLGDIESRERAGSRNISFGNFDHAAIDARILLPMMRGGMGRWQLAGQEISNVIINDNYDWKDKVKYASGQMLSAMFRGTLAEAQPLVDLISMQAASMVYGSATEDGIKSLVSIGNYVEENREGYTVTYSPKEGKLSQFELDMVEAMEDIGIGVKTSVRMTKAAESFVPMFSNVINAMSDYSTQKSIRGFGGFDEGFRTSTKERGMILDPIDVSNLERKSETLFNRMVSKEEIYYVPYLKGKVQNAINTVSNFGLQFASPENIANQKVRDMSALTQGAFGKDAEGALKLSGTQQARLVQFLRRYANESNIDMCRRILDHSTSYDPYQFTEEVGLSPR